MVMLHQGIMRYLVEPRIGRPSQAIYGNVRVGDAVIVRHAVPGVNQGMEPRVVREL